MISNRPYLIRAIYDWIVDNEWTPHMQVDANYPGVDVPVEHIQEGIIVLNVSPTAVGHLNLENELFSFRARFSGIERSLRFPPEAVLAVFARENGHGMPFPPEPYESDESQESSSAPKLSAVDDTESNLHDLPAGDKSKAPVKKKSKKAKKPTLSVVK
ncbi:ClpXP protease specificity-enhancing factor [Thiomicrorhabdus indica]|uniref:ClpXP protease specificity-enhancing factor n=1 Tax=Thiomicrorhabdus indica TaxID=2267253 RepID=UPI002AA7D187|nr:ClpXP protease specificity-enhancing factor [Thiomicrorhabdus indica]